LTDVAIRFPPIGGSPSSLSFYVFPLAQPLPARVGQGSALLTSSSGPGGRGVKLRRVGTELAQGAISAVPIWPDVYNVNVRTVDVSRVL